MPSTYLEKIQHHQNHHHHRHRHHKQPQLNHNNPLHHNRRYHTDSDSSNYCGTNCDNEEFIGIIGNTSDRGSGFEGGADKGSSIISATKSNSSTGSILTKSNEHLTINQRTSNRSSPFKLNINNLRKKKKSSSDNDCQIQMVCNKSYEYDNSSNCNEQICGCHRTCNCDRNDDEKDEHLSNGSERLLEEPPSNAHHAILNPGEDDEMHVTGYCRSKLRTLICWVCIILTGGILRLVMHWWRHWYLLATHTTCPLKIAEKVLVREEYQGKHTMYYVKSVIILDWVKLQQMQTEKSKWENCILLDNEMDEKNFHLTVHFSSGYMKHTDSVRLFRCKQLRYIWESQTQTFQKLKGLDVDIPTVYLHQSKGLNSEEQYARRLVYGANEITIPYKGVFTLLFLEVVNPFYVFQIFSVILWFTYNYYYYAVVIIFMSTFGITMSILQTKKNQDALRKTVSNEDIAQVVNESGEIQKVSTRFLVPGDVIEIPSSGCTLQCDAVLLSGNCILDESMLTGESVPVTKTPLPIKRDLLFDKKEHARHTLFCGTKVIQTRYIGSEKVLAVVINTGNITAKGGLIRSILYPPPVDYKFEQDSYKFIGLLGLIACVGFIYTLITKILREIPPVKIAVESLDLITIVVPPALPAAMTVGRFYAQKRLERQNIYCISPRSINVSGSIDCVCFDKTGTLTEDGLDMWGVVPKTATNEFQIPLKEIERLPNDHFLYGMVTCHSITIMGGEMKGDPLDLKMFESTGWILEDANVPDDNKYDLLFPTIVRQPKSKDQISIGSRTESMEDNSIALNKHRNSVDDLLAGAKNCNDIGIVREFSFTSALQRMSVITRCLADNHFNVYCKGSPEMIHTLCHPKTMPDNYFAQLDVFAQLGYRIIAVAYKSLDKKITYPKAQRIGRDKIECDLEFLGFVILENRLKPDTSEVIKNLTLANIRTVMVTGDNILTALSVAKDCGMITKKQSVITVNTRCLSGDNTRFELYYNLTGADSNSTGQFGQTPVNNGDILSAIMTNSNSVASLETTETWTHRDVESCLAATTPNGEPNGMIYDDLKMFPESPSNNYRFAMVGKTWSIVREHFPELLPRFVTRGTIFARMSPDQKQSLIIELQDLGYYVAMCGDGANDCGALKVAHTGISLSEAESSVASPFTSRNPTIACVPTVIREGRAALVTSFGIFKYMAAYSMVQFISVMILYSIDSNLTDKQYLYIDLGLISIFAFFFGKTAAYAGPLNKQTPLSSLISLTPIVSIVCHLFFVIVFQVSAWYHLRAQEWFVPFNFTDTGIEGDGLACHENYTIFIISCFQYIIMAIVFSKGVPYRKSIISNYPFCLALIINIAIVIYFALYPSKIIVDLFELTLPPTMSFSYYLIIYGAVNFIIALFIEEIIIEFLLFKKLRYRFHNIEKSRRKYLSIENDLRQNYNWPSLSTYQNDIQSISNDNDKSPVSYAEISAEHQIDVKGPENSVLNSFFENPKDDDFDDDNCDDGSRISNGDRLKIIDGHNLSLSDIYSESEYESAQNDILYSTSDLDRHNGIDGDELSNLSIKSDLIKPNVIDTLSKLSSNSINNEIHMKNEINLTNNGSNEIQINGINEINGATQGTTGHPNGINKFNNDIEMKTKMPTIKPITLKPHKTAFNNYVSSKMDDGHDDDDNDNDNNKNDETLIDNLQVMNKITLKDNNYIDLISNKKSDNEQQTFFNGKNINKLTENDHHYDNNDDINVNTLAKINLNDKSMSES